MTAVLVLAWMILFTAGCRKSGGQAAGAVSVQPFIDRWLAAQNAGDFPAYASLYAKRFEGVRRTGSRVVRLDHDGWVKDRERMFKKPMTVTAADVRVTALPTTAQVLFTQTWASGGYKDAGTKQMILMKEGEDWKISREEMLESRPAVVEKPLPFYFAFYDGSSAQAVLDVDPDVSWGRGEPELRTNMPRKSVDLKSLPKARQELIGQTVRFMGAAGQVCEGAIADLALFSHAQAHFGTEQGWAEAGDKAVEAAERWAMGKVVLTAEVKDPAGRCSSVVWAQMASDPAPGVIAKEEVLDAVREGVLAALAKAPAYKNIQADFEKTGGKGPWIKDGQLELNLYAGKGGAPDLLTVHASNGDGCGDFAGDSWTLWRVGGGGPAPVKNESTIVFDWTPQAIDIEGDGEVEFLGEMWGTSRFLLKKGADGAYREVRRWEVPFHDCGC